VKREFDADGSITLGENGKELSYVEPTEGGDAYEEQIIVTMELKTKRRWCIMKCDGKRG
jgi:hypothetical protein